MSMIVAYDPYHNAIAERVNGILKDELRLEEYKVDRDVIKNLIGNSICVYNTLIPNYSCSMLTS